MADDSTSARSARAPSKRAVFLARSASTVALWALVFGALLAGSDLLVGALVVGLGGLALYEFLALLGRRASVAPWIHGWVLLVGIACLVLDYLAWTTAGPRFASPVVSGAILVVPVGALVIALCAGIDGRRTLEAVALPVFGFFYIVCLFAFLSRFHRFGSDHWHHFVLLLLVMTKFTDMGAYLTGSLIGRHKMIPHISPGKTWEGTLGAFVFTFAGGAAVFAIFHDTLSGTLSWADIGWLTPVIGVGAVVGDLVESLIKRSLGAKDSGNVLPGIGGALDLIDSLLFTAPLMFLYLVNLGVR